ncbi:hypothetical protein BDF14DRAFT_670038 [Spinellus fusiger]|nr:hypothetical protein BDF14DRAFT_670038 [Spinellus fusiger]
MPPSTHSNKRKSILPLHIDTASFTTPPAQSNYPWRRMVAWKRQSVFIVFLTLFLVSAGLNIHHYRTPPTVSIVLSNDPLPPPSMPVLEHAIIVAGHAIYTGPPDTQSLQTDEHWTLEPYQKHGQVFTFQQHIQKGIALLKDNPKALLIFTGQKGKTKTKTKLFIFYYYYYYYCLFRIGHKVVTFFLSLSGQTRPAAGPHSEAISYWQIAQLLLVNATSDTLLPRMVTEEFARDSHENLLFSFCRFSEITGHYPSSVTVVGFEFKRSRFQDIHRASLRYPADRFEYIGIDPPHSVLGADDWKTGEALYSYGPFQKDKYGCHGTLRQKKIDRNPYRRRHAYRASCPALVDLLNYCPANNKLFAGLLPWDKGLF